MRKLIFLVATVLATASSYADMQSLTMNSLQMKALNSAWGAKNTTHQFQNNNDITIVYGGADISRRPTLAFHTTTT